MSRSARHKYARTEFKLSSRMIRENLQMEDSILSFVFPDCRASRLTRRSMRAFSAFPSTAAAPIGILSVPSVIVRTLRCWVPSVWARRLWAKSGRKADAERCAAVFMLRPHMAGYCPERRAAPRQLFYSMGDIAGDLLGIPGRGVREKNAEVAPREP